MTFKARLIATAVAASAASLAFAGSASASFHEIKIKEVFLGSLGNDSFVELQMYSPNQTQVAGQTIKFFTATGATLGTSAPLTGNVGNGQSQRTILIGDSAVTNRDFAYSNISPIEDINDGLNAGGAVCFSGLRRLRGMGEFRRHER